MRSAIRSNRCRVTGDASPTSGYRDFRTVGGRTPLAFSIFSASFSGI